MLKPCVLCKGAGFYQDEHVDGDPEDKQKGLYQKYWVSRTDRKDKPGEKHCGCTYFVLDLKHDKYAPPALRAYAAACEGEHPELALSLRSQAAEMERSMPSSSLLTERAPDGHVGVKNVQAVKETSYGYSNKGALLVRVNRKEVWVPKYCIHDDSEVYTQGSSGVLVIPLEMAEEKGLA